MPSSTRMETGSSCRWLTSTNILDQGKGSGNQKRVRLNARCSVWKPYTGVKRNRRIQGNIPPGYCAPAWARHSRFQIAASSSKPRSARRFPDPKNIILNAIGSGWRGSTSKAALGSRLSSPMHNRAQPANAWRVNRFGQKRHARSGINRETDLHRPEGKPRYCPGRLA